MREVEEEKEREESEDTLKFLEATCLENHGQLRTAGPQNVRRQ